MVGDPELNSFFKNNPMQVGARKLPTKSCSYSQDDHRRSAVWKPTARHFEYVPKFAVYQGKRIETTIQPTAANALQEGHTFGGRGYANMLGVASDVPDPHIADIGARRSPHNKNPRRWTKSADQVLALAANGSVDLSAQRGEALDGHAEPNRHAGKRPTTRPTSWRRCQ